MLWGPNDAGTTLPLTYLLTETVIKIIVRLTDKRLINLVVLFDRMSDLDRPLMQEIMEFIYWLVEVEELPIAKALRQILVDKQKQLHFQQVLLMIILCTYLLHCFASKHVLQFSVVFYRRTIDTSTIHRAMALCPYVATHCSTSKRRSSRSRWPC